jgi:hypothetical protein
MLPSRPAAAHAAPCPPNNATSYNADFWASCQLVFEKMWKKLPDFSFVILTDGNVVMPAGSF